MKKLFLLILISGLILQLSHSQDYVAFPTDNATWNTLFYGQYPGYDIYTINYQNKLISGNKFHFSGEERNS